MVQTLAQTCLASTLGADLASLYMTVTIPLLTVATLVVGGSRAASRWFEVDYHTV